MKNPRQRMFVDPAECQTPGIVSLSDRFVPVMAPCGKGKKGYPMRGRKKKK